MRVSRVPLRGCSLVLAVLASCVHGAPSVAPTAVLAPRGDSGGPRSEAPFQIVASGPRGEVERSEDEAVTVVFNRAMRDLEHEDDEGLPAATIRTKEGRAVDGRWRFVGTRGLIFEPSPALPAGTEYEVVIPGSTRALDGAPLGADHRFAFSTRRPTVVHAPFAGRRDLRPGQPLVLELDQVVDPGALASATKILVRPKPLAPPRAIAVTAKRSAKVPPGKAGRIVELTPVDPLPLDHVIEVVVDKGLRGEGPLPTTKDQIFAARTYGPLRLEDVACSKQTLGRCRADEPIAIVLSNAVSPKELLAHLSVKGGEGNAKLLVSKAPKEATTHHLVVPRAGFGKRYGITLRAGLRDVFGQVLAKDLAIDVDTEAPFSKGNAVATAEARTDSEDGPILAAMAKPGPGVSHRPRLSYEARIGIRGSVVEALANAGPKSHVVPVGIVNVPTVGLFAGAIDEAEVTRFLGHRDEGPRGDGWRWSWWSPGAPENVRSVRSFDLDALLPKKRGAALLATFVPGAGAPTESALVSVTDLAITARMSKFGGLVWITRLSTGAPVANASVKVVLLKPKAAKGASVPASGEVFAATTDASGFVSIPAERFDPIEKGDRDRSAILIAREGDDWTFAPVRQATTNALAPWDVDLEQKGAHVGMLFTERGVYRPGEVVKVAGVVRRADARALAPPVGKELRVKARDGEGNVVVETRAKVDAFGTFAADVPLPRTTHLGIGAIEADLAGEGIARVDLTLAAYKASAFKLAVDADRRGYVRGDDAVFTVTGDYLYGAPMAGAGAKATFTRAPTSFVPPKSEGFDFGEDDPVAVWPNAQDLGTPEGDLDDEGRFSARAKLVMPQMRGPERLTFEVEVEDTTRQTVSKSTSVIVHPAEFYLGLRRGGGKFLSLKGSALDLKPEVAAFDPSGGRRAGVPVTLQLVSRRWTTAVAEQADGSPSSTSKLEETTVATCTTATTAQVAGCTLPIKEPGFYLVRATAKDPRGFEVRTTTTVYATSDAPAANGKGIAPSPSNDRKLVTLELDKPRHRPGESAKILIHSPFREAQALVTIERAGVHERVVVPVKGPTPVVDVPVRAEWFPNVFVAVELVRGRIQAPPASGVDLGGPDFRVGATELRIDPESHRLAVSIQPSKKALAPGETFDADVAVVDATGRPSKASVTFYAVDEGVLMLTGYKTPDPLPSFTERRRVSTFGLESREGLARILPMRQGEKVPILGFELPAESSGWNKGGEYGDGEGGPSPRADFRATAFFEAGRVTGEDGRARFRVKLPDNLTTYRLMAVAATGDDRFGFGESNVVASKRLMIRPALPRQLRVGDAFEAAFVLSSKDLPASEVDVVLKAQGLAIEGATRTRVKLAPGAQVPVRFAARATGAGQARLEVEARAGGAVDRIELTRKIELPISVTTAAVYGETTGPQAIGLGDLSKIRPDQGGLAVKVASSALVGIDTAFERLLEYPYGCTEQITSRILPLLTLQDLAQVTGTRLPARTDDVIDAALGRLVAHQGGDGGFGFWKDDPAVPWLSAYVVFAFEEAGRRGFAVPKSARDQAIHYLRRHLPRGGDGAPDDDEGGQQDPWGIAPEIRRATAQATGAIVLDALASVGAADPGATNGLYDRRGELPIFAQAHLLHAMARAKLPAAQLAIFAKEIEARLQIGAGSARAEPEGALWSPMLDSGTRSTALVLRALLAVDPRHPLAPRLVRGLLDARENGAWRSTQENVWSLIALDAYRRAQEPKPKAPLDARIFLGGDELGRPRLTGLEEARFFVPAERLKKSGGPLAFALEGTGKLFYAAELRTTTSALPTRPLDRGLFVQRLVRSVRPTDLQKALESLPKQSTTRVRLGELVLVDLLFETGEPRDQIVIDDPLPSGVEPIDVNLETVAASQAIVDGPFRRYGEKPSASALSARAFGTATVHREHHDDRVLTFLGHVEPGIYHFRYLGRATAAGTYVLPPARAEAMYAPEIQGRTAATTLAVTRE